MDATLHAKETMRPRERLAMRKLVKWLLLAALLIAGLVFAWRYWQHSQMYASTDNAYVNADTVEIAAQVGGPVVRVHVRDNQQVKVGDPLFDIDPQPYRLALEKAQAQLQLAEQTVAQQSAAVAAAEAAVAQRQAELRNAQSNNARNQQLVRQGFLSQQGSEAARTQAATAEAALHAAQASLEQARSALGLQHGSSSGGENATVQAARAAVEQAELDLQRTRIVSPTQGVVANLTLRPGNTVQPGTPLFVLISNQEYWVDANFKETELEDIRPGQRATVTFDMYPDHPFHGVVESVSGGAGTAFSLLPPQNATGNWVKVTQRVPVRVRITDTDPRFPLRIGTTATVEVALKDTQQSSGR